MRTPDFARLRKVIDRQNSEPVLFEFFMNPKLNMHLAGDEICAIQDEMSWHRICIHAFANAGYDYVTMNGSAYPDDGKGYAPISCMDDLEGYHWPDPDSFDYSVLDKSGAMLPEGMKIVSHQYDGIWEMAQKRLADGYAGAAMLMLDDPELCKIVFDEIGSRYLRYYEIISANEHVGACLCNDDWGFKTQTMINPDFYREYVFPWYKKIVEVCHKNDKPVILHSCGKIDIVMDDIISDMKFDAKHSFEDAIMPVEDAYDRYHYDIAIMGGIDMDFLCRKTPAEIRMRCEKMLERAPVGYALGSGNSIPDYVPFENYFAMIDVIRNM